MCNAEGVCGESPTRPTPRTIYSAKSEKQYREWGVFQAQLNQSAADFCAARYAGSSANNEKKKPAIVFLGDSITEAWIGTNMGGVSDRAEGVPQVFKESFSSEMYDTLVLAIGGDQVQHLQWRLEQGGELPAAIRADSQATFVLLIGTNNLGSGILPGPTLDGVVQLVESILKTTKGRLVVLKLLPRGDDFRLAPLCPPRCDDDGKPYKSFMPAIRKVNDGLQQRLGSIKEERLQLVDCGKDFEGTAAEEVDGVLMPDKLHPNADGHRKFAACIKKYL
jgi:lysophospholipase L1-like esterase